MLDGQVTFAGAWFEDTKCRAQLSMVGTVSGENLDLFARCIATLPLGGSARSSSHPEIALATYAPGLELELLFGGSVEQPKLRWIGYVSRAATGDALPTVTQAAFESRRIEQTPFVLDEATQAAAKAELGKYTFETVFSWFKVCVDAQGAITGLHLRETSSLAAMRAHEQAIRAWKLRPFMLGTQPTPVCALVHIGGTPRDRDAAAVPPLNPLAKSGVLQLSPWLVEGRLVGDSKLRVHPDDSDRAFIPKRKGPITFVGLVGLCFTPAGTVEDAVMIRPSGLPSYDRRVVERIRQFRYRPIEVDGIPVAACSHMRFALTLH